ncbi:leucine rich repeat domain-containing protein [Botrytis cinerea]
MDTEDGQFFIKNLAHFVRTHEKALANALQLRRQQTPKHGSSNSISGVVGGSIIPSPTYSSSSSLPPYLTFASHNIKPAKLALTPHHLFYLLSRFEDLGVPVGPMNVRLENLHADTSAANYVSFLSQSQRPKGRGSDNGSIHSVSSVRSVMSGMSSLWSNFGLGSGNSAARTEKQKAAIDADLKYLYSAFTKIPCLRLAPDRRARLIEGYEEFPFDSAVPLIAFKNISALEISDIDIRQAGVDDLADLLINIVLDDMDKRRRRSSKAQMSPTSTFIPASSPRRSPTMPHAELIKSSSAPGSPDGRSRIIDAEARGLARSGSDGAEFGKSPTKHGQRPRSNSPVRPPSSRTGSSHGHLRGSSYKHLEFVIYGVLPSSKWRFLKHLSIADNGLTAITASSLAPLANTLHSLDLSSNLFAQIPDCLASLTALRALNLSNNMIESLHSLTRNPLPAISALNLRWIERLYPLERLDLRDNKITDPTELARLTGIPDIREIWISGNPFTKTHSNYRTTIFNLFRQTPGYTEDILIDAYGPGYTERRHLVERAAERPGVPVVKPPPPDYGLSAIEVNKPIIEYAAPKEPAVLRKERPMPVAATSEINTGTTETSPSKQGLSRIVMPEEPLPSMPRTLSDSSYGISPDFSPRILPTYVPSEPRQAQRQPDIPRINTSVLPRLPPMSPVEAVPYETAIKPQPVKTPDTPDWNMSAKKAGRLKKKSQPPGYQSSEYESANTMRPGPTIRAVSQQTIHSGRTLG